MNEIDMRVVRNYYNNMLKVNDVHIIGQKLEIERRSYARWAIEQIMERVAFELMRTSDYISGEESLSLVEVVSLFVEELSDCVEGATKKTTRRMFEIARDEARLFLWHYVERRNR